MLNITRNKEEKSMKRVFILGAGASRELNFNITGIDSGIEPPIRTIPHREIGPLSNGYFYHINRLQDSLTRDLRVSASVGVSDNLMNQIKLYFKQKYNENISKEDLLNEEVISKKINIERLYIFLEEKILEKEKENVDFFKNKSLQNLYLTKSDLIEYIHNSMSYISYYCISINHATLSKYIIENGGDIISFNWDILFEEAMMSTGKWTPQDGYGISFTDIIYKNEGDEARKILPKVNPKNLILKPHGSINWYNKDDKINKQRLLIQLALRLRGGNFLLLERQENSYLSSIIPPGKKRKSFPGVWDNMKRLLEEADEIIAIGFSFNDNDKYIKEEFDRIKFKKDLKIIIVNPNNEELKEIYKAIFCTDNICMAYKTFSEYCRWINK